MRKRTRILYWFYKLSWKKMLGIGGLLLIVMGAPLAVNLATNPTRTRSEAALLPRPQPVTTEFETPRGLPKIFLVDHFFGKVDDAVLIHGENLGGLHEDSWVSLAGKKIGVENLVSWTGSYIEFKVPAGAKSGLVEISVLGKRTVWPGMFFVTDQATEAELRITGEPTSNQGQVLAKSIKGGQELLIWLLVISGDGDLKLGSAEGVRIKQSRTIDFPVGKVYEAKLSISSSIATESQARLVPLLTITKADEQLVGIARGELGDGKGALIPLQLHPLYVSF